MFGAMKSAQGRTYIEAFNLLKRKTKFIYQQL